MNKVLSVAALQMNSQQDIEANLSTIKAGIEEASTQGAQLIVLPENCCSMGRLARKQKLQPDSHAKRMM